VATLLAVGMVIVGHSGVAVRSAATFAPAPTSAPAAPTMGPAPTAAAPATPEPSAASPQPACSRPESSYAQLSQSLSGQVSGCWLVGPHAPGVYSVGLSGFLGPLPSGPALGPKIAVSLSQASGAPGTEVTLRGRLSTPVPARLATTTANICFDGCDGLEELGVTLHWAAPATRGGDLSAFSATALVPDAPWFVAYRAHGLLTGAYPIGISCAGREVPRCGLHAAQGSAVFHLVVTHPEPCSAAGSCSGLRLSPAQGQPGTAVRVRGNAPITTIIAGPSPSAFGYTLSVASPPHNPTAQPTGVTNPIPDGKQLDLAPTPFKVLPARPWSSLPSTRPVQVQLTGPEPGPVSADVASPTLVASCGTGLVNLASASTGAALTTVPTSEVATVKLGGGFSLWPPPTKSRPPTCTDVLVAPGHPVTYYTAFQASGPEAQPIAEIGLVSTDAGQTWHVVPAPTGSSLGNLSGFELQPSGAVAALFTPAGEAPGLPELVEQTTDSGAHWKPAGLRCPQRGACLLLGPYAPGNCAMNGTYQQLLVHARTGTFEPAGTAWPGPVGACNQGELAATSGQGALVVNSGSPFLLLYTSNSGRSFSDVAIPPLAVPNGGGTAPLGWGGSFNAGNGGLVLLPDGALLETTGQGPPTAPKSGAPARVGVSNGAQWWHLLEPGASRWCTLAPVEPAGARAGPGSAIDQVYPVDGRLWWTGEGTMAALPTGRLSSVSLSSLTCR